MNNSLFITKINNIPFTLKMFSKFFFFALFFFSSITYADIYIVVNKKNDIDELSKKEIVNIFMGKVNTYPNGMSATPLDQLPNTPVRKKFYKSLTNKSQAQISAYWAKLLFTGRHVPPRVISSQKEMTDIFSHNASAITYIDEKKFNGNYKIIYRITVD